MITVIGRNIPPLTGFEENLGETVLQRFRSGRRQDRYLVAIVTLARRWYSYAAVQPQYEGGAAAPPFQLRSSVFNRV